MRARARHAAALLRAVFVAAVLAGAHVPVTAETLQPELFDGETLKQVTMPGSGPLQLDGWTRNGKATVYTLDVKTGTTYRLRFTPSSAYAYLIVFDLARPDDEAMYSSDINGKDVTLTAQADTTWLIRPYFSRVAPRRGLGARYSITIDAK